MLCNVVLQIRVREDSMPAAHIAIAFETCGWDHPDRFELEVIYQTHTYTYTNIYTHTTACTQLIAMAFETPECFVLVICVIHIIV